MAGVPLLRAAERRDVPFYGLLVCNGQDARMFVVHHGQTIGYLTEFCRQRFGLGRGPLRLRAWDGRLFEPHETIPPEGTPLVLASG